MICNGRCSIELRCKGIKFKSIGIVKKIGYIFDNLMILMRISVVIFSLSLYSGSKVRKKSRIKPIWWFWISVSRDYITLHHLTIRYAETAGVDDLSCLVISIYIINWWLYTESNQRKNFSDICWPRFNNFEYLFYLGSVVGRWNLRKEVHW